MNDEKVRGIFDDIAELTQAIDGMKTEKERNDYFNQWKKELNNDDNPIETKITDFDLTTVSIVSDPEPYAIAKVPTAPNILTINNSDNEMMVNIDPEGNVTFGKNYTPGEAAEVFWTSLGKNSPMTLQKEIDELNTKRFTLLEEIDELKEKLDIVTTSNQAFSDKLFKLSNNVNNLLPTVEDFTLPHPTKRIGSLVTTLPPSNFEDDLQDIEYFRSKLNKALKIPNALLQGHPAEKIQKQLAILEDAHATKEAIRNGGYTSVNSAGVDFGSIEPNESVYYKVEDDQQKAFERAMKVVE